MKTKRVSLDIDKIIDNKVYYLDLYNNLEFLIKKDYVDTKITEIEINQSASGKGRHVIFYLNKEIDVLRSILYRSKLGDDINRVHYSLVDYFDNKEYDILFSAKKIKGKWRFNKNLFKGSFLDLWDYVLGKW